MTHSRGSNALGSRVFASTILILFFLQMGITSLFAGDLVRKAQETLVEMGINPGPVDGLWGPKTQGAVKKFQEKEGLPVSGRLDDATKNRLLSSKQMNPSTEKTVPVQITQEIAKPEAPAVPEEKIVPVIEPEPVKQVLPKQTSPKKVQTPPVPKVTTGTTSISDPGGPLPKGFKATGKYKEGTVSNGGAISGVIKFSGNVPLPIMEDLSKGKNVEFCSTHPDAKGNIRPRVKVSTANGNLKDAVVFIQNIETGKAWSTAANNFDFQACDIFPKVSVVWKTPKGMKTGLLTITNQDPDVLHNPHGYSIAGANRKTLFNKPLPSKGDVADVTKTFKRFKPSKDRHFFLQCDQHNFMEADARVVWNPYYSLSGADGAFKIDQVPAGKYWVTAWHPYIGEVSKEVTVAGGADAKTDFELVAN